MISAFLLELKEIRSSFYLFSLLTWIPFLSFLLIVSIFHKGVANNLPISVVDYDQSRLSSRLIRQIDANPTLHVQGLSRSVKEASKEISSSRVYATVVIPKQFERDVKLNKNPKVTALVNSQYLLIGKMIDSALSKTILYGSNSVDFITNLNKNGEFFTAKNLASPIGVQITPFFNTYQNYFLFLVSAIIPTLIQILIVLAIIASMSRAFEHKEKQAFLKKGVFSGLVGKTMPYTLGYFFWGVLFILYMYGYEGWEFQGSFAVTFLALFLTVIAYEGVALSFFVLNFDSVRALSLGALYTAPAFAFLGVTFPVSSMPKFAHFWHNLLPISHYLKIQISQASYGTNIGEIFPIFINLLLFLPIWVFVILKIRKKYEFS